MLFSNFPDDAQTLYDIVMELAKMFPALGNDEEGVWECPFCYTHWFDEDYGSEQELKGAASNPKEHAKWCAWARAKIYAD